MEMCGDMDDMEFSPNGDRANNCFTEEEVSGRGMSYPYHNHPIVVCSQHCKSVYTAVYEAFHTTLYRPVQLCEPL
jgi:hypothetical protein